MCCSQLFSVELFQNYIPTVLKVHGEKIVFNKNYINKHVYHSILNLHNWYMSFFKSFFQIQEVNRLL